MVTWQLKIYYNGLQTLQHYINNFFPFQEKLTQQTDSIEQFINHPAPPHPNKEKLTRTHSSQSVRETYLPFDVTFKDLYPSKPLHVSYLACHTDSVKQYGQQAQDIRLDYKKREWPTFCSGRRKELCGREKKTKEISIFVLNI